MEEESRPKQLRGFAAMDPERQREIASLGGKAAHAQGKAYRWTSGNCREAARKGGLAAGAKSKEAARKRRAEQAEKSVS